MAQIIKHRRGSLESLSQVTGSLVKGEIVIATGSANLSNVVNGQGIVFAAHADGAIKPINRILKGSTPAIFSGSTYNGLLDGVPFYATSSNTLYLLSSSANEAIDLSGNISAFSSSVSASLGTLQTTINASNIFQATGSAYATTNNIQITGSLVVSGAVTTINKVSASNINVGTPTSNDWGSNLGGSYFNNFNQNTDVSEILRFVAGLLSSSAPDASPNTKTFSSVTANAVNTTTGTALTGRIPQSSTNTTINYLNSKGFAATGSTIFSGIGTIYTNSAYGYTYTSVAAGSTVASSSVDAQLFGLGNLSSGTPTSFKVSGSFNFKFKDNSSKTDTATSSSQVLLTQTGAGTTSGVTLAKINTANSAVIPAAYQDGKFAAAFSPALYNGGLSVAAATGSGYYHISASISIASGSSGYTTPVTSNAEIFYAPLTTISGSIIPAVITAAVTASYVSATSRSLSGAPYLLTATYTLSSSITNTFSPLFYNGTNGTLSLSGTGLVATSGITSAATSNGTISTANAVYDSTGVTARNTATIPYETDIIKLNGLYTFSGSSLTNIAQSSITPTTWTVASVGYNMVNTATTANTNTFYYHSGSNFGQPIASGSMAYYTRPQGADTSTALVESFTGENYRIQLADNVLAFNGTAWSTSYGVYNLGATDLQVKPGYLVKPGGTYGYWITNPSSASAYKYYIRKFTTSGTKSSMTLNLGQVLSAWTSTSSNAVSAVILFESSKNTIYTPARVYDPSDLINNFNQTLTANTDGTNPFGSNMALYGNTGGSLSSTTYTIPLRNADGMALNATYTNIYVIVRYNGDPTPITSITTTFS